ncbi:MAG: hypothetical protein QXK06_04050 [Candidatus Diapherotrites archaeon]
MLFVLDASAVLNQPNFSFNEGKRYVTTPLVLCEFRSMESRLLVENALKHGVLSLREPKGKFVERVKAIVKKKGYKISEEDVSIIALGLELKAEKEEFLVLTDDFSIQNFLAFFKIPFSSAVQGEIREVFSFSRKCSVCGKEFSSLERFKNCPDCGVPLKSRIKKKKVAR